MEEEVLKASDERYQVLFDNAGEGIVVAQDGKIQMLDSKMTELSGLPKQEILGRLFEEFVHPEDNNMINHMYEKRLHGNDPQRSYGFDACLKLVKEKGFKFEQYVEGPETNTFIPTTWFSRGRSPR